MSSSAQRSSPERLLDVKARGLPGPVLLLGFDAAEASLVQRGIAQGWLPTIAAILRRGRGVRLEPPQSAFPGAAWATTMTGTPPSDHLTILDAQLVPGSYRVQEVRADDLARPPFWRYLSDAGCISTVASIYGAPMLKSFNGTQVVGWGTLDPEAMKSRSFRSDPPEVLSELRRAGGRRDPGPHVKTPKSPAQLRRYRDALIRGVRAQTAGLELLLRRRRCDFFHASFNDAHPAGHLLWHLMDTAHPRYDPVLDPPLGRTLVDIYSEIDRAMSTMLRLAGDDASVFVLSPHGIGPNPAPGNALEVVLERGGYLVRGSTADEDGDPRALWLRRAYRLGRLLTPPALRPAVARLVPRPGGVVAFTYDSIDWRSTRAFELHGDGTSFVRVNLTDREPNGTVAPGDDYNSLCEELAAFIEKIEYADTGAPAAVRISRTEPVDEPVRSSLPDLCVEWGPRPIGRLRHPDVGVFDVGGDDPRTGHHRSTGFLVGAGPAIEPSNDMELAQHEASLLDVAPTMLARLGVDVPREMSGDPIPAFSR